MNPGTVLGLSVAACLLLCALVALGQSGFVLALAIVGAAWALVLNHAYARKLGAQARTPRRMAGDRAIARQMLLSYLAPGVVAVVLLASGWDVATGVGPLSEAEVQALVGVVGVTVVAWLASSHVDWYYIRPRIDGVVGEPPCRSSRDTKWKGVTRKWYLHRTAASLTTMLAVGAIALIVTLVLGREWPSAVSEVGGFAAIFSVGIWMMRDEIRSASPTSRSIRTPRHWVGDDLKYETDMWKHRGYVLHVAVPVTKLVPLSRKTGAPKRNTPPIEESATTLYQARCQSLKFTGCLKAEGGCASVNAECTHGLPRGEEGRSRPFLFR